MKTNKNKYRPRTADTSIVTSENILILTLLVESAGYKHHCPPSLGLYDSIKITMIYLAENLRQTTLATIFGVSQPTISRAITKVVAALNMVLPPPPDPYALDPHRYYVLDGTLTRSWNWKDHHELFSGKHATSGHNLQVLTDQAGDIYYISPPQPGSYHDMKALKLTGLLSVIPADHITADKGYIGSGCDVPFKKPPGKQLEDWHKRFNKQIQRIRYVVERSIAHLKTWKILSTPCRLPLNKNIQTINLIRKIIFYEPPPE